MEELISLFIDDELDIDQKNDFVKSVVNNREFAEETLALLSLEAKLRRKTWVDPPSLDYKPRRTVVPFSIRKPLYASAAAIVIFFLTFVSYNVMQKDDVSGPSKIPYRFVLFEPGVEQVELAGDFSKWSRIPMVKAGDTGYWSATVELPAGEYRFSYVIEGSRLINDPTIPAAENDDFGGKNSVIEVKGI